MTSPSAPRRLIVNADDFGRSRAVNEAVIRAHREGILTSASLMVNEPAAREAAALARDNPRLGVGLHLTLLCGRSALPPEEIPGLVNARQEFRAGSARAGWRFFFQRGLLEQLRSEIHAQFDKFRARACPWTTSTATSISTSTRPSSASSWRTPPNSGSSACA